MNTIYTKFKYKNEIVKTVGSKHTYVTIILLNTFPVMSYAYDKRALNRKHLIFKDSPVSFMK